MVLKSLTWEPKHGNGVTRWIKEQTGGTLQRQKEDAALYQALHRMERRGWIKSEWGLSENNRRAKYYRPTAMGRRQLGKTVATIRRYSDAMWKVLEAESA